MTSDLVQIKPSDAEGGGEREPSRRAFIKTLGVVGAASALTACQNPEHILPLLVPDPRQEAGRPQFFATVCRECPAGCGMVVKVNDGRPTKAEGNPDHPVNRGKLCLRGQTALQGLYNPDRIRQPLLRDAHGQLRAVSWPLALERWQQELTAIHGEGRGGGVAWLGQLETGTMDQLIRTWLGSQDAPAPLYYEAFSHDALRRAFAITHGAAVVPGYHMDRAKYLVSFGAEFLETWISNVEFAGDFAAMHSVGHTATPARVVCVGARLNLSAANADEYWPARAGTEALLAWALLQRVGERTHTAPRLPAGVAMPAIALDHVAATSGIARDVIERAADRLVEARPSLVLGTGYANDHRGALSCQIAVNLLNDLLGNTGVTVAPGEPHALSQAATQAEVLELFARAQTGAVRMLLLHHANPAYHHPGIEAALAAIPFKVSFAHWMDETTQFADLILPDHHWLESWGDYAPRPGVTGVLQPTRVPLYDTRPTGDLLVAAAGGSHADWLRNAWQQQLGGGEAAWNALLQKGVTASAIAGGPTRPTAPPAAGAPLPPLLAPARYDGDGDYTLTIFPSIQFYDGRQANRSWAQEIAEPLSKLVWDGWCELHPTTAEKLGLKANEIVRLRSPHGTAEFPLFITTWIRPDTVGVLLGQGHTNFGMWANGRGDLAHKLQSPQAEAGLWSAQTVKVAIERTGKSRDLANLQVERLQRDKKMALAVSLDLAATPAARETLAPFSFYDYHHPYQTHRWGMAIDLDSCIGCNACQAACYAENNIAIWGRSSSLSHREMTWIRVEVFEGDAAHPSTAMNPDLRFLPIPCQQCGNAPCEYVCPTFASYHTDEGLNGQVYNRCVGTRYCSNNCIYKVRRFNWYTPQWPQPLEQQLNPQVTVRAKGVMEKCTFCIQRITAVELDARTNHTAIRDGDIQTACQQSCPTDAIVFGDLLDADSRVVKLAALDRAYGLMADENTYPSVSYLKRVKFELNQGGAGG